MFFPLGGNVRESHESAHAMSASVNDPCRMADNKNQHFVPKAHLKPFSVRGEGSAIHLFNLDRAQIFCDAPVKNQCARDYFYGQDARLERAIQLVEGEYARCVSSLHEPGTFVGEVHATILRRFAYLQHLRTEAAAQRSAELAFTITDVRGADIEQPTFKEAVRNAVIDAMRYYAETMDIIDDLKVRIVRNITSDPFITSDDPAVLANRWHQQDMRALHRSFGIVSAGLVLFLPLSPTLLALSRKSRPNEGWSFVPVTFMGRTVPAFSPFFALKNGSTAFRKNDFAPVTVWDSLACSSSLPRKSSAPESTP